MKILVVDDEPVQLQSLKRGLATKGHQILEALNAKQALEIFSSEPGIDLVLTDYAMPEMNGLQMLNNIREAFGNVPVIMMTAFGEKELIIDALRKGCNSFIEKPFTLDILNREIARVIKNKFHRNESDYHSLNIPRMLHQLNNPLMSIMGSAELGMLNINDPEEVKKRLTGILKATNEISLINSRMLQMGTADKNHKHPVNLSALISGSLDMFKDLFSLKTVQTANRLPVRDIWVNGHQFNLEQVFKNLFLNAVEAMDQSQEKKLIVSAELDEANGMVSLSIADTGCGIAPEHLDHIFDSYFTQKTEGTGLGLAVVKDIIDEHQGRVRVQSQLGLGTTFVLELPVLAQKRSPKSHPEIEGRLPAAGSLSLDPKQNPATDKADNSAKALLDTDRFSIATNRNTSYSD